MRGGYYRVDLTPEISLLAMNTMYFDSAKADLFEAGYRGYGEMEWLREQLSEESDRKFILGSHVYTGARYKSF